MITIGEYNTLTILRETTVGLFLGDEEGADVLLPNKYCPEKYEIGQELKVYVYLDYDERKVATNLIPLIHMHEFALLEVTAVSNVGAFLDWGLEKNLMVPFREQRQTMEEGRWYVVYMDLDKETDRLFASNKVEKYLDNEELTIELGEEVELLVYRETELGYSVIVNDLHKGLVFKNEVFKRMQIGDKMPGYIKTIHEDNKLDVSLTPIGYENFNSKNAEDIFRILLKNKGFLPFNDKSAPGIIYKEFGISKKAFKRAIGELYKDRKISIEKGGIRVVK